MAKTHQPFVGLPDRLVKMHVQRESQLQESKFSPVSSHSLGVANEHLLDYMPAPLARSIPPPTHVSKPGSTMTAMPRRPTATPATFDRAAPYRQFFSARKMSARTAIHTRFMTPTTTSTDISAQQHPRQYAPCDMPARNAERVPPPKSWPRMKANGLWQAFRQTVFQGVNWYAAATSRMAPATTRTHTDEPTVAGRFWKARNAPSGTRPIAVHTKRYPRTNAAVGGHPSPRCRTTTRWARTIGPMVGNIMATIMVSHIPRKTGGAIPPGIPLPICARPVTMPDIVSACRTV